jgi:SAM-dependent methyltransferase
MLIDRVAIERVHSIDWDFPDAYSHYGLHRLHWYPGTFIPQIPAFLIEIFSRPGQVVLDPFCGVGTTLVEAARLGRIGIGYDVNPLAVLVARAKTFFFSLRSLDRMLAELDRDIDRGVVEFGLNGEFPLLRAKTVASENRVNCEELKELKRWYHPDTWREMLFLWGIVGRQRSAKLNLFRAVFSSIVKSTCSQREHWGYVADNMRPRRLVYRDAIVAFRDTMSEVRDGVVEFLGQPFVANVPIRELNRRVKVALQDTRAGLPLAAESVDLVVTSPPYPNVTDYARSQRLSYLWLGMDLEATKEREIGARFKRQRKTAFSEYVSDLSKSFSGVSRVLRSGGYLCVVIGESERTGGQGEAARCMLDIAQECGLEVACDKIERQPSRQRLRRRSGEVGRECLLVFRKPS